MTGGPRADTILELEAVNTFYGRSHILFDLGLSVRRGSVTCLLGRNGAGKTTTIRSIMGLTPPRSGTITLAGHPISGLRPWQIYRRGVKIVPQGRGIFPTLSVEDNLRLALLRAEADSPAAEIEKAYALFPVLGERRQQPGRTLSGGELQMLAIARALLGRTDLILMDEPSEGLAPLVIRSIQQSLHRIKGEGVTVLLAEQNARLALEVGDWHYIIDNGRIRFAGDSAAVLANEEITTQHLGVAGGGAP